MRNTFYFNTVHILTIQTHGIPPPTLGCSPEAVSEKNYRPMTLKDFSLERIHTQMVYFVI